MKRRVRDWRLEIILVGLLALAVFLLVERGSIRETLWGWVTGVVTVIGSALGFVVDAVLSRTISDLLGLALIILVVVLARWRLRWRIQRSPSLTSKVCPVCSSELHRVHRHWGDKVISTLIAPAHRYVCKNKACGWSGLRFDSGKRKPASSHSKAPESQ